jgi:hypothetical protein
MRARTVVTGLVFSTGCAMSFLGASARAAGGHYAVDDAVLVDAGRCQIEAWYARSASSYDITLVPACNPSGNLEIGFGVSRVRLDGEHETVAELTLKTLFRELETEGWGSGLALTTTYGGALERRLGATIYAPVSARIDSRLTLHSNVGWSYDPDEANAAIWGIGSEWRLSGRMGVVAEIYGTHRGGAELQMGQRYDLGKGALDLGYGRARGDGDGWLTVGVGWQF